MYHVSFYHIILHNIQYTSHFSPFMPDTSPYLSFLRIFGFCSGIRGGGEGICIFCNIPLFQYGIIHPFYVLVCSALNSFLKQKKCLLVYHVYFSIDMSLRTLLFIYQIHYQIYLPIMSSFCKIYFYWLAGFNDRCRVENRLLFFNTNNHICSLTDFCCIFYYINAS